jgi:polysaccharide biosynthesis protein PslH
MSRGLHVLVLWRSLPTYYDATSSRIFNFLKYSRKYGYEVSLICYGDGRGVYNQIEQIKMFCKNIIIVQKPKKSILHMLREIALSPQLIRELVVPTHLYSRQMQKEVDLALSHENFDVLYCDRPMIPYVINVRNHKILDVVDPVLYSRHQLFIKERNPLKKIMWLTSYLQLKVLEIPTYKNFDACVTVSDFHKLHLKSYHAANVSVIPYGIDLEHFRTTEEVAVKNSALIFTGAMNYIHNVKAVLWFYEKVFPLVKKRIPTVRLLIVGKQPTQQVLELAKDGSVSVTGYVEDVRPYFERASVGIVPMVTDDGGFKTKILEAMAMCKPIVSTSMGLKGIDAIPGKEIIIADGPMEFAESVVGLLNDEGLRLAVASNARKMVETKYSWETMTDSLAQVIENVAVQHKKRLKTTIK